MLEMHFEAVSSIFQLSNNKRQLTQPPTRQLRSLTTTVSVSIQVQPVPQRTFSNSLPGREFKLARLKAELALEEAAIQTEKEDTELEEPLSTSVASLKVEEERRGRLQSFSLWM